MKARLLTAYVWDCDACGLENFERAIVAEMSAEDEAWLREEQGMEDFEQGELVTMPERVKCRHCGAEFETEDDRAV